VDLPPGNPTACGAKAATVGPDGVYTGSPRVYVHPSYTTWSDLFLESTLAQELGHLMGLDDVNCPSKSVINTRPVSCGDMTGMVGGPLPGDAFPVANTTYGSGSRQSCR
jgi:hypothetical protein